MFLGLLELFSGGDRRKGMGGRRSGGGTCRARIRNSRTEAFTCWLLCKTARSNDPCFRCKLLNNNSVRIPFKRYLLLSVLLVTLSYLRSLTNVAFLVSVTILAIEVNYSKLVALFKG